MYFVKLLIPVCLQNMIVYVEGDEIGMCIALPLLSK